MSHDSFVRVRERLHTALPRLEVITIDLDGSYFNVTAGVGVARVDPQIMWASLDLVRSGQIEPLFQALLQGERGEWLQLFGAGVDNPVFRQLMAKGIRLSKNTAHAPAIAEYVMAHAFSLLHPLQRQARAQRDHTWLPSTFREMASTRWMLIGYGAIGKAIADRVLPFGTELDVSRRNLLAAGSGMGVHPLSSMVDLLPAADVVVLACALNAETRRMANAVFFESLKQGSILINVARGGLVDEAALQTGLQRSQPGFAVLDVFATEPLPTDSWLWDHPNVRITAHCSHAGDGAPARNDDVFIDNLHRFLDGRPLLHEVGPDDL